MDGRKARTIEIHPQKESEMNGKRTRKLGTVVGVTALLAVLAVPTSMPASAVEVPDQVLAWNQHAYDELIVTGAQAPPVAVMHLAMVHGAIYDAVNAIDGGYEPYLGAPAADGSESRDAAAAAAAYQVLRDLLPAARDAQLDEYYAASLNAIPDGDAQNEGEDVGEAAAAAMIDERDDDGRFGEPLFTEGTGAGDWRNLVAPLDLTGNNFKWVGDVEPFLIPDAAAFATAGPLDMSSAKYAAEFAQVKALGRATGSTRNPNQTSMAHFWADHAVAMWTRIFRQVSENQDLSTTENARYFAMLYLTGSDALIACFQDKERHGFWRPTTAIRFAEIDGNPATIDDDGWTALLGVPPYPDHPSGHNCVSGSFVRTLRDFFGTNRMSFSAVRATSPIGRIERSFTRFSQAINEIRLARVYGGLHFMTADAQAATLGRKVANWRQAHYFQPVA
ncbi:MAG TPA: vanadium-dependent haloperoxidase [Actinomycetota bacterium]|nr:vanadium-dependent haloperoxidase [Actinomycetota bacterium]